MRLLVLYEELAGYFVKCIATFADRHNAEVHIIRKQVNKEAPFVFDLTGIKVYSREDFTKEQLLELAERIQPDAILCGGWASSNYLAVVSRFQGRIPTIVGFDNKWEGTLKQQLASVLARFYITNRFSACFVPGEAQKKFAMKMGFRETQIETGAYCCDFDLFRNYFMGSKEEKTAKFPHRFIYAGRYVQHKGLSDLWKAFISLQEESPNDWELWCIGTGELEPVTHPRIKHFGFVQPDQLADYIHQAGVFVLPSHFEPWGVVVHEFASAGFPLICSDAVGAAEAFVGNGDNGYIYKAGDVLELKRTLSAIMSASDASLLEMSASSAEKAKIITPEKWSNSLMKLIKTGTGTSQKRK